MKPVCTEICHSTLVKKTNELMAQSLLPDNWRSSDSIFCPYMLTIEWNQTKGWGQPCIEPVRPLQLHPSSMVLHYGVQTMESIKAYRGVDGKIRIFRPHYKLRHLNGHNERAGLPSFSEDELLKCLVDLICTNENWVPACEEGSLYIRPVLVGTEPSYDFYSPKSALLYCLCNPRPFQKHSLKTENFLKVYVDPGFSRSWPGGVGMHKMACLFAPTIKISDDAKAAGCHMPLWVFGLEQELTEAGGMNVCLVVKTPTGSTELITPTEERGLILPGVIRDSILTLANEMQMVAKAYECRITMDFVRQLLKEGRLVEMFGCGTGAMVNPVGLIVFKDSDELLQVPMPGIHEPSVMRNLLGLLTDIQLGRSNLHPEWTVIA